MSRFQLEEYAPAGVIVFELLKKDLADFTVHFRHVNSAYLDGFKQSLEDLSKIESRYARDKDIAGLTDRLYRRGDSVKDKMQIMRTYFKLAGLDTKKTTQVAKMFNRRNIEAAVQDTNAVIAYAQQNSGRLTTYMPPNFLSLLEQDIREIVDLNNEQNERLLARREFTNTNKSYYDAAYRFITEVCHMGKIVYKKTPIKRDRYNLTKIKSQLKGGAKPQK